MDVCVEVQQKHIQYSIYFLYSILHDILHNTYVIYIYILMLIGGLSGLAD